jgi:hypothetical protein
VYSDEKDAGLYLESLELLEQACKKQTKRKKSENRNQKKRQQSIYLLPDMIQQAELI